MNETYNDWVLVSLAPWAGSSLVWIAIALVLAGGVLLWSYRRVRWGGVLAGLRLVGILVAVAIFLEPAIQWRVVRRPRQRVAILVDNSQSMGLTLDEERRKTRHDVVLAGLERSRRALDKLGERYTLQWANLQGPTSFDSLSSPPDHSTTNLLSALESVVGAPSKEPLAGVVLLSDGIDHATLRNLESDAARSRVKGFDVPINAMIIGAESTFRDVALVRVVTDEFAFVHNTITVDVDVEVSGFSRTQLPLTLLKRGSVVDSQEVLLDQDGRGTARFSFKPDEIGEFVYHAEVPVLSGEKVVSNNRRSFTLKVIRDKIRVLHVAGRPSWDERFLRQHLKRNPNVDLVSFFILRTPADVNPASDDELSLIPFPVEKLFTTELATFDVVVFQNFDYRPYHMAQYLPNIRRAVEKGLAFVMLGGAQSFADGGYVGTEFDGLLPFGLEEGGLNQRGATARLTEAGRHHPVTDIARGGASNDSAWARIPRWVQTNQVGRVVEGATVLVQRGDDGAPVIAVREVGEGRAMGVATDSMWRWRFSPEETQAERAYHRFWSNALRWLMRDPADSRVRVVPIKREVAVQESPEIVVTVRDEEYRPAANRQLTIQLLDEAGGALSTESLVTSEAGTIRKRYEALGPGAYFVEATLSEGQSRRTRGQGLFVVSSFSEERVEGFPRPDVMKAVAEWSGGKTLSLAPNAWSRLALNDVASIEVDRRRNVEFWDNAIALLILVAVFSAEWGLRRRLGYI